MTIREIEEIAMTQLALLPGFAPLPDFDGETYEPKLDRQRLSTQLREVERIMLNGEWLTIAQIVDDMRKRAIPCREAGISARIRDLRKARFGGYNVERRRAGVNGVFEYRIARKATEQ
jgi:hypothetical protein